MHDIIRFPRFHSLLIPIGVIGLLSCCAGHASAAAGQATWSCWYDRDTSVRCRLKDAPADKALSAPDAPRLPGIVRGLRERPGAFAGRELVIPLHTEPYDMDFVRQLARAVMCGAQTECHVDFVPSPAELVQLTAQELVDRSDAALED